MGWRLGTPKISCHSHGVSLPRLLSPGPMSNVTSPCSQQLTDSIAPGHAMALREHEPAVGRRFPTAIGMIPQTDLLG